MKAYTLNTVGIKVWDGRVILGQSGRGRHRVEVPLPSGTTYAERKVVVEYAIHHAVTGERINGRIGEPAWAEAVLEDGKYGEKPAVLKTVEHWEAVALDVPLPGGPNEALLLVPATYGFRGSSWSEAICGASKVAEGISAEGDAGRMASGNVTLWRVADGGRVRVRSTGRRVERGEIILVNAGGVIVEIDPSAEAEKEAVLASLNTPAPVVSEEERQATKDLEHAKRVRDAKMAELGEAAAKKVAEIKAETDAVWAEVAALDEKLRAERELRERQERAAKARAELGNGFAALANFKIGA